jgi:hypothetical protein
MTARIRFLIFLWKKAIFAARRSLAQRADFSEL